MFSMSIVWQTRFVDNKMFLLQAPPAWTCFGHKFCYWCISLQAVPVEFRIFPHFALLIPRSEWTPTWLWCWKPLGFALDSREAAGRSPIHHSPDTAVRFVRLPRRLGTESYLASPSTVAKRLGVVPYINIDCPGGSETPHGKTNLNLNTVRRRWSIDSPLPTKTMSRGYYRMLPMIKWFFIFLLQ